ncbi:MAG: RluA family pseudouridine synthase [Sphaerochaetaceae bacterium]
MQRTEHARSVPYTPLPIEPARRYCLRLREEMERTGFLDDDGKRRFPSSPLFEPYGGRMFGMLVCTDDQGNERVLKAFSGQYLGAWEIPGWVPPVPDVPAYEAIVGRNDASIHELSERLKELDASRAEGGLRREAAGDDRGLRERRRMLTQESQRDVFALYSFCCYDGASRTFSDMAGEDLSYHRPLWRFPSGTGDCCAPKLLHQAFSHRLHPVSMAEFYFGAPNRSGTKTGGSFYPPCEERCHPLLRHMLGLDILYCDDHVAVVNKPSGLLSVPGRGEEKQDSVETRFRTLFPTCIRQPAVHRLDMDTSGLLILARDADSHRNLNIQFMNGIVAKEYVALLEGIVPVREGIVELPFRLDVGDRPRQIYDERFGKKGTTLWERLSVETLPSGRTVTRVRFIPHTGRTHQLRVHSAHEKGLGHPVVGDRLYGTPAEGDRLALHASKVTFRHPATGDIMTFDCPPEF